MQILQRIEKYISENNLLDDNEKIIVGVSGGVDSMVLLDILSVLGYDCMVAHCNFHLRGEESDRDERFVKNYCSENGLQIYVESFDTYSYMKQKSVSLEMAARELRYQWFERLGSELSVNKIAIAHHQDDSVETFLINLIRGSGIHGLTGISPKSGKIVRPLLCLNREEIIEYAKLRNIPFVEDSTNNEDIYTRNKLRLNIIPELEAINPSVKKSVLRTASYLQQVSNIYDAYVGHAKKEVFDGRLINIPKLETCTEPKAVLFEILHHYGFNSDTIDNIYAAKDNVSGRKFYSESYCLLKDRDSYILSEKEDVGDDQYEIEQDVKELTYPFKIRLEKVIKDDSFTIDKSNNVLYADLAKVEFPLHLRKWKKVTGLFRSE
ncbi:MAG: tRNA lysidine(34) synthetase TilS [Dysgonomonas sp.]